MTSNEEIYAEVIETSAHLTWQEAIRKAIRLTREADLKELPESTYKRLFLEVGEKWEQERAHLKFELLKMTESRTAWKQLRENADEHIKKLEEEKARMMEQISALFTGYTCCDRHPERTPILFSKVMAVLDGKA